MKKQWRLDEDFLRALGVRYATHGRTGNRDRPARNDHDQSGIYT